MRCGTGSIFHKLWQGNGRRDTVVMGVLMGVQFLLAAVALVIALAAPRASACWPSTLLMVLSAPIPLAMLSNLHWNTDRVYNSPLCRHLFLAAASYCCLVIPFGAAFNMDYTMAREEARRYTMVGLMVVEMVVSLAWVYPLVLLKRR